jgi:capsular polysaccharide transport system ATP-binding protein
MAPVIILQSVHKRFPGRGGRRIAEGIDAVFPQGQSVALLGGNGAGKSTLLQLMAGTLRPDSGRIVRTGRVSWPVGLANCLHRDMTGAQNLRFLARLYGVDGSSLVAYAQAVTGLGAQLDQPVAVYSAGMRARLAFAAAMGIPFDHYLIDEVTAVGDAAFRRDCEAILRDRLAAAGAVVVSHSASTVRRLCTAGAVLSQGRLVWFDRVGDALAHHAEVLAQGTGERVGARTDIPAGEPGQDMEAGGR